MNLRKLMYRIGTILAGTYLPICCRQFVCVCACVLCREWVLALCVCPDDRSKTNQLGPSIRNMVETHTLNTICRLVEAIPIDALIVVFPKITASPQHEHEHIAHTHTRAHHLI